MPSKAIIINGVAAFYSAIALGFWFLVNAPFATISNLPYALLWSVLVLAPYGFLFVIHYAFGDDTVLRGPPLVASIVALLLALPLYALSFAPNDGEYGLVYIVVPIMQLIVGGIAICLVWWRMWWNIYRPAKRTPNRPVENDAMQALLARAFHRKR